ncbi:MAG: tRNA (guanosine(37)-N1)-methyltransferase TrmD [Gammaproteobacteria bacterium]|nr:tRNA (guanosine(37)-N1)-methyltransferase TrmD [Gammaproteobacteria bacterium]
MNIGIVTVFPELFEVLGCGITGRALRGGLIGLSMWDPRDYTQDAHRTVDGRPYGGGPGMVMRVAPLQAAIAAARAELGEGCRAVYLSPQGARLDQRRVETLSGGGPLVLVCGRYEGVDERLVQLAVDEELSIGDFVLSGGELAAMALVDAITRLLPGALGHAGSAPQDSFADGLLDCPHFTRPQRVAGLEVPAVLLSGDHEKIAQWRLKQALGRTYERRPDLLAERGISDAEQQLLNEYLAER